MVWICETEIRRKSKTILYGYGFIVNTKADDIYKDIAEDVEIRFETLNYEIERPLPKGKNKKLVGLMKDELGKKIIKEFVKLRVKTYS